MIDRKEAATALAVEVLDELRVSVLECLLALDAISQETIIDFEPLTESLAASGRVARQAFIAASLLNQDAEFAPLCRESDCMTPGSIINRHWAAVAEGAPATPPDRSDVDDFETEIGGVFARSDGPLGAAQHPHLLSIAEVEISSSDTEQAVAPGQYHPAASIEDDRDAYRRQVETALMDRRQRHMAVRRETIRTAGNHVVQQWMERRASSMAENA
ncbi:hypothetical protein D2E60_06275 [Mycobacteroides abscessus]|nr:hypothetical protein S7W_00320 [Mycobacteroides abscessus M94]PVA37577.1 hypothetical protein DDJ98_12440 [Mycobacteroides abscessus]RIR98148.1 hypothetical protein D2E57_05105 [Mycobacteroides abscessus]RIS48507.1 hypothetical protein D2E60_06275 [Mycobacteroides abscessus]